MAYVSKKQQVLNILTDLENTITARNVDIGINILNFKNHYHNYYNAIVF